MFTRNDLISYLSDLEMAEVNMRDIYIEAIQCVTDETLLKLFKKLSEAEERHRGMVSDLRKLIIKKSITES
jgi:rubrerythrin